MKNKNIVATAGILAALALTGCSGSSIEGTYLGTAGGTVLILEPGGACGYTEDFDKDDGVQVEIDKDCSWSLPGSNLNPIGVSRHGLLTAFVGDDGTISIPDQNRWSGEIYTKK